MPSSALDNAPRSPRPILKRAPRSAEGQKKTVRFNAGRAAETLPPSALRRRLVSRRGGAKNRMARLKTISLHIKSLFARERGRLRFSDSLLVSSGPIAESARALDSLARPRLKIPEILDSLHSSSATAHIGTGAGRQAREMFMTMTRQHLDALDDVALYRMHRKMTGRRMRAVSAALHEAASREKRLEAGRRVMGQEFSQMAETLDMVRRSLEETLRERGFLPSKTAQRAGRGERPRKKPLAEIQSFSRDKASSWMAGGGALPKEVSARFDDLIKDVNEDAEYSGAFAEYCDPMSGRLAVTEPFLRSWGRQRMEFETPRGGRDMASFENAPLDSEDEEARQALSKQMLAFCQGREVQALRLSRLMSAETADLAWKALASFNDGANPYVNLPEAGGRGLLYSREGRRPLLHAERREDGSVDLTIEASSDLQGFRNSETHAFQFFDGGKSGLGCHLRFTVPASEDEPVRMGGDAGYDYQIFQKPAATAYSVLPAHWARPV